MAAKKSVTKALKSSVSKSKAPAKAAPAKAEKKSGAKAGAAGKTASMGKATAPKSSLKKEAPKVAAKPAKGAPEVSKKADLKKGAAAPETSKAVSAKSGTAKAETKPAAKGRRMNSPVAKVKDKGQDPTLCREVACDSSNTSAGYCRLHYIKNWKKIKRKEGILKEGRLVEYIEELVRKYPEKYIEAIRADLSSDKEFSKVVHDLELDEGIEDFEAEGEGVEGVIDTIKRGEIDDDADAF